MKKGVRKSTRVEVYDDTLQKLNIYKAKNKMKSHDKTIKHLLEIANNKDAKKSL